MARYTPLPLLVTRLATEQWPMRSPSLLGNLSQELGEGLIEQQQQQEKRHVSTQPGKMWRAIYRVSPLRRYGVLGGLVVLTICLFALRISSRTQPGQPVVLERKAQTLHLIVPTPEINSELCKTILSAEVLQYSTPTVARYDTHGQDARANAQSRMKAVRDYLATLVSDHGNDTVILLDGANTWFQLRPEVLIKRYYDINRRANNRLAATIDFEVMRNESSRPSVIFSAASECGATAGDAAGCSHVPVPSLSKIAWRSKLPRYLSKDLVMGTVADLHAIYQRAVAMIEQDTEVKSELAVLSKLFHNQEQYRARFASKTSWLQHFRGWFMGKYSHGPLAGRFATAQGQAHAEDLGIGLDYSGELSVDLSKEAQIPTHMQRKDFSPDVAHSMPPFWSTTGEGLPVYKTWSDVDMFTTTDTHAIPVVAHTNNMADSTVLKDLWRRFWLQPYSRKLLDAYMSVPAMPLASVIDNEGVEQVFWSTTIGDKAGVKDADGKWYGWEDICKGDEVAEEVFGDGLGEWIPTRT